MKHDTDMNNILDENLPLDLEFSNSSIIKVIGVGGGGGNAVNHMYKKGITDVTFVVCNTDYQDLIHSPVPIKLQLGKDKKRGLGAGGKPEVARKAAEESREEIKEMLLDNTEMIFITAGMGGGTGTGASPVVAQVAQELGILTVGIVTIPFAFEGTKKILKALEGVASLSRYVDAILVINNEKLKDIYPDLEIDNAFSKADDVLANAAKAVAEIITVPGYINTDFADVNTILRDGKVAIMNTGYASGENRLTKAIEDALNSPLLNTNDVKGAKKVLLSLHCSTEHKIKMEEIDQIHHFMAELGEDVVVIWGATFDDNLGEEVKITLIATGFDVKDIPGMPSFILEKYENNDNENGIEENLTQEVIEENKIQAQEELKRAAKEIYGGSVVLKEAKKEISFEELMENLDEQKNTEVQWEQPQEETLSEQEDIQNPELIVEDIEENEKENEQKIPVWKRRLLGK